MNIITLIIIGLSLSMDAFTLSLAYGLINIPKKTILLTSLTVGIFHFIMPLIGSYIGYILTDLIHVNNKYILITVLIIILIEMIKSLKEEKEECKLNFINIIIFSFLVSFDSFSIGIGIKYITNNIFIGAGIFSLLSCLFTFLGFYLGKYLSQKVEKYAKIIGIILISFTCLYFIFK